MATNNPMKPINMIFAGIGFLCGVIVLIVNSQQDEVISVIDTWSPETKYQVLRERNVNVINNGVLGNFYYCIKRYEKFSTSKFKGKPSKKDQRLWLLVNNEVKLNLSFNFDEAYRFYIEVSDKSGELNGSSKTYTVSCDLSLLNAD